MINWGPNVETPRVCVCLCRFECSVSNSVRQRPPDMERTLESHRACLDSHNNRELAVYDTLSSTNRYLLLEIKLKNGKPACSFQKQILDGFGKIPPDRRDEEFAGFVDRLTGRQ